ncbi:hypothetical protein [Streptomyces olivochromogenes]|uniref:hypothetical protein n=1 Tax=Streptomyces olivochromogenes TaxID=1963 RepID=UPI001F465BED|nr:hypothetical protein [Streptomyces olivochromogenes]MCF3132734.1 hypothetical protein [Streptomyces olivochromogenes]
MAVKSLGATGKIKIVGFGTADPIVQDVKDGLVQGPVVQEPLESEKQALQQIGKALKGFRTTGLIHNPFVFLTKDTF